MNHSPEFRLMIQDGDDRYFGLGSYRLLKEIQKTRSVKEAAADLDLSYSKAWKILNQAEIGAGTALVDRRQGGKRGGLTELTEEGRRYIRSYEAVMADLIRLGEESFRKHFSWLKED